MQLSFDAADRLVELVQARHRPVAAEEAARVLFALERAPVALARSLLDDVVSGDARLAWRGTSVGLADRFATEPSTTWLDRLDEAGIPAGPILDVAEALATPQATALGNPVALEHASLGPIDQVGIPFELAGTPAAIRLPPPLLGEHTDDILAEAGHDRAAIARLRAMGVVG